MQNQETDVRHAAVLLVLYPLGTLPVGIFTVRTSLVAAHKGQISLPGGSVEPGDESLVATALRETREELGIESAALRLVGQLPSVFTVVTGFIIHPFVAYAASRPDMVADPFEVESILDVPISSLRAEGVRRIERWDRDGVPRDVYFYDWNGGRHVIWGATGRIIHHFLEIYSDEWWRRVMDNGIPPFQIHEPETGQPPTAV